MTKKVNGITYQYITYNNRYSQPWQYVADNLISKFIAQDINQEFAFVVTYQCTKTIADARICVYQPGLKKLIPFGCVMASAQPKLDSLCPQETEVNELTDVQKRRYFVKGYIVEGYID